MRKIYIYISGWDKQVVSRFSLYKLLVAFHPIWNFYSPLPLVTTLRLLRICKCNFDKGGRKKRRKKVGMERSIRNEVLSDHSNFQPMGETMVEEDISR